MKTVLGIATQPDKHAGLSLAGVKRFPKVNFE